MIYECGQGERERRKRGGRLEIDREEYNYG